MSHHKQGEGGDTAFRSLPSPNRQEIPCKVDRWMRNSLVIVLHKMVLLYYGENKRAFTKTWVRLKMKKNPTGNVQKGYDRYFIEEDILDWQVNT